MNTQLPPTLQGTYEHEDISAMNQITGIAEACAYTLEDSHKFGITKLPGAENEVPVDHVKKSLDWLKNLNLAEWEEKVDIEEDRDNRRTETFTYSSPTDYIQIIRTVRTSDAVQQDVEDITLIQKKNQEREAPDVEIHIMSAKPKDETDVTRGVAISIKENVNDPKHPHFNGTLLNANEEIIV